MSIFSTLFSPAPATAPAVPATAPTTDNQTPQSPMDNFASLWDNTVIGADGKPITPDPNAAEANAALFNVDPKAIQETVGKMNFIGQIPPKVQEALKAGGDDAVKANLYLMNQTSQQAFSQAMQMMPKMIEAALEKQAANFESQVSNVVKKNNLQTELRSSNPIFAHPAAAPLIQSLEAQYLQKYPNASPQELSKMAQNYLADFAGSILGTNKPAPQTAADKGRDFSDFF